MMREQRYTGIAHYWMGQISSLHRGIFGVAGLLSLAGILMLYSAAAGNLDPWALRQAIYLIIAVAAMLTVALFPMRLIYTIAYPAYAATLAMLIAVELAGFVGMGAQRWVALGPVNFQPSELMKIALILALARYYHNLLPGEQSRLIYLIPPALMVIIPSVLILMQPNLGTTLIIVVMAAGVLFAAGVTWKLFAVGAAAAAAALPAAWQFLHDYQKRRVLTFLEPDKDPLGAGYNIMQSKIAIGSGGLFGKGFLQGTQSQLAFLPEKQTDFIFPVLVEEFGFLGGILTLAGYALLIFMIVRVALGCSHQFGRIVAMGVALVLFLHVLVNIGMVMGLLPVVGLPLPLLSYGGSSLITIWLGLGLVLNAHLHSQTILVRETL